METYYQRNRERISLQKKEYYRKHRDKKKKYYEEHRNEAKKWRIEHPEKIKMYRQRYAKKQKEYYEKWYKENGRNRTVRDLEKILEWRYEHPERVKIHDQLNRAVNSGKLERPEICPKCRRKTRIHAHHINYDHFMNFLWLCASCHKLEHAKKIGEHCN